MVKTINIRRQIVYQADYLDLKDTKLDNATILKDLRGIQASTNLSADTDHLTVLCDIPSSGNSTRMNYRETSPESFRNLLFSFIGIPYNIMRMNRGMFHESNLIDTSHVVETELDNFAYNSSDGRVNNGKPAKDLVVNKNDKIIGVVFLHTLMYESEIAFLLQHFTAISSGFDDAVKKYALNNAVYTEITGRTFRPIFEDGSSVFYKKLTQPLQDKEFTPKAVTLMFTVYSCFEFIKDSNEIFTITSNYKDHSVLNWMHHVSLSHYRGATYDRWVTTEIIPTVTVHFTYFPRDLSPSYYFRYVSEMMTTKETPFTKSLKLKAAFDHVTNEKIVDIWRELNSVFSFDIFPENLINTMSINQYSGTFNRATWFNDLDRLMINDNIITSQTIITTIFKGQTTLFDNLLLGIKTDNGQAFLPFKTVVKEIALYRKQMRERCQQLDIEPLIAESTFDHILYFLHYFFVQNMLEIKIPCNSKAFRKVHVNTTNHDFFLGCYNQQFNKESSEIVQTLVNTKRIDEIRDIIEKARDKFADFMIESLNEFLVLNKDFNELLQSCIDGKNTEHIDKLKNDYKTLLVYFLDGNYMTNLIKPLYKQYESYVTVKVTIKLRKPKTKSKKTIEQRLFELMLRKYNGNAFRHMTDLHGYCRSGSVQKSMEAKTPKNELIKIFIQNLETKIRFDRIV